MGLQKGRVGSWEVGVVKMSPLSGLQNWRTTVPVPGRCLTVLPPVFPEPFLFQADGTRSTGLMLQLSARGVPGSAS